MRSRHRGVLFAAVTTAATLFPTTRAAAQFTNYGIGCGLTNSADTEPYLGMTYRLRTTNVPATSLALAVLGLAPTNLPLPFPPFCTLLASPDVIQVFVANAAGEAETSLQVPQVPALVGLSIYDQWFGFDLVTGNVIGSDGGVATVDNPQLQILGVVAPPQVVLGSPVTIDVRHAGTLRPQDVCIGIVSAITGERGLIRAIAIQPLGPNDVRIQGVVMTPAPDLLGHVMVMRGDGNELLGPIFGAGDWGWIGPDLPEAGGMGQSVMAPTPPFHLRFTLDGGDVVVEVPASTPTNGNARIDAHWNAGGKHYDSFLTPVPYSGLTPTQFRDTVLLPNLQTKYGALYPGVLQITADTISGNPAVRIHMADNSTCTGAGGSVWF